MPVKVIIPTPLRQYTEKRDTIEVSGGTVAEALSGLTAQYAALRKHLYTDEGKLRSFVNVYLNDEDIRYLQKDQTKLSDNDVISIVPSIAGGCAFRPQ
jgi:molybdopterin converting factor small subunit